MSPCAGEGRARLILGSALLFCVLAGAGLALARPAEIVATGSAFVDAVRGSGKLGTVIFVIAQVAVAVSGVLPAALLGTAAGIVYGAGYGFALAAVSTLAGAQLAFVASRSLLRGVAERALIGRPRLQNLDAMVARDGWRIVSLLRISPVMPFSATSYALGLTSVSASDYLIGTLAALPALYGYVLLGALAQNGLAGWSAGASPMRIGLLAIGGVATLAMALRLWRIARLAGLLGSKALFVDSLTSQRRVEEVSRLALRTASSPMWRANSISIEPSSSSSAEPSPETSSISSEPSQVNPIEVRLYSMSRPLRMRRRRSRRGPDR